MSAAVRSSSDISSFAWPEMVYSCAITRSFIFSIALLAILLSSVSQSSPLTHRFSCSLLAALKIGHDVTQAPAFCRSLADLVNRDDVRMVKRACGASFLREAAHSTSIGRELGWQ